MHCFLAILCLVTFSYYNTQNEAHLSTQNTISIPLIFWKALFLPSVLHLECSISGDGEMTNPIPFACDRPISRWRPCFGALWDVFAPRSWGPDSRLEASPHQQQISLCHRHDASRLPPASLQCWTAVHPHGLRQQLATRFASPLPPCIFSAQSSCNWITRKMSQNALGHKRFLHELVS